MAITPGSGATIGTETATVNAIAVQLQQVKQVVGARDAYTGSQGGRVVDGTSDTAAAYVDVRPKAVRISVTPTISTSAYVVGYNIGGQQDFANAVRASGGSVLLQSVQVIDNSKQNASLDLIFFDRSITAPTDHAAFNPSNADLAKSVGWVSVPVGAYSTLSNNSVAAVNSIGLEMVLNGTDLFLCAVTRSTPTYAASALTFILTLLQD